MKNNYEVVDLFCGIGGLTHGFILEGFNVIAGFDSDNSCEYVYEKNNSSAKFIHSDLGNLDFGEINKYFSDNSIKILVGCAPCQDFSIYNLKNNKSGKYQLLTRFANFINEIDPEIISMENVPNLLNYDKGETFTNFIQSLEGKYNISYSIVNAKDYGVPQRRKRLVLLGCKKNRGRINLVSGEDFKNSGVKFIPNVREAIGHLPKITDGEVCLTDKLHRARRLSDINKKRIKATKEGGFWRDWPDELILDCHKKESGKSFRSVYGRMKWDEESPTMTTYCIGLGNGRFGHPEQDRAISLREAAIFQSFPEYYDFINPNSTFSIMNTAKHIGNAVPVSLARAIAQSIKNHIECYNYE